MSAIINALFGTYSDQAQNVTTDETVVAENTTTFAERLHTSAIADDVHVKSEISSEVQAQVKAPAKISINNILSQLNTTHSEVDQYARDRTAEINEQVQKSIADILLNTQRLQEELLQDANRRHLIIENEYKLQLQKAIEALDSVKAKSLADLERELQVKQEIIMTDAKKQIDNTNDQANAAKLHALVEAQEHAKQNISSLADQYAVISHQETANLLQSQTTTVIKSHAQATGIAKPVVTVPVKEVTEHHIRTVTEKEVPITERPTMDFSPIETIQTRTYEHSSSSGNVTASSEVKATCETSLSTGQYVEMDINTPKDNTTVK